MGTCCSSENPALTAEQNTQARQRLVGMKWLIFLRILCVEVYTSMVIEHFGVAFEILNIYLSKQTNLIEVMMVCHPPKKAMPVWIRYKGSFSFFVKIIFEFHYQKWLFYMFWLLNKQKKITMCQCVNVWRKQSHTN